MKTLPTAFRSDGFDFELLARDGDIALFRKTKPRLRFESLEVVVIQRHENFEIEGKLIPAGEHFPRSEQWGSAGWSYRDRPSANCAGLPRGPVAEPALEATPTPVRRAIPVDR